MDNKLPVVESELLRKEEDTGLESLNYIDFVFILKRYTYKSQPFNERIFEGICPDLGLDWERIKKVPDRGSPVLHINYMNKNLFEKGIFNLHNFHALGFLLCSHKSK